MDDTPLSRSALCAGLALVLVGACTVGPQPLVRPPPAPAAVNRTPAAGLGGDWYTTTAYCVETDGRPSEVRTWCPSGDPELDRLHREAVAQWKFAPARRGDKPVRNCSAVQSRFDFPRTVKPPPALKLRSYNDPDQARVRQILSGYEGNGCVFISRVDLCINETGAVDEIVTSRSSGIDELDVVTREAIETWQFEPFIVEGAPRRTCSVFEHRFRYP